MTCWKKANISQHGGVRSEVTVDLPRLLRHEGDDSEAGSHGNSNEGAGGGTVCVGVCRAEGMGAVEIKERRD